MRARGKNESPWERAIATIVLVILGISVIVLSAFRIVAWYHKNSPSVQEQRDLARVLQPLVESQANKEQISKALDIDFNNLLRSSTNRWVLEHRILIPRVRELAERYPDVLFHPTAWTMTWLFFDGDGRLQEYYLCEQ